MIRLSQLQCHYFTKKKIKRLWRQSTVDCPALQFIAFKILWKSLALKRDSLKKLNNIGYKYSWRNRLLFTYITLHFPADIIVPFSVVANAIMRSHSYSSAVFAVATIWLATFPVCESSQFSVVSPFPLTFRNRVTESNPIIRLACQKLPFDEVVFLGRFDLYQYAALLIHAISFCIAPCLSGSYKFITRSAKRNPLRQRS